MAEAGEGGWVGDRKGESGLVLRRMGLAEEVVGGSPDAGRATHS